MTTGDVSIVRDGRLDLEYLRRAAQRPSLFAPHEVPFWDDPHTSRQMLAAHLDPNTDAASRKPETIDRTVEWLVSHLRLQRGHRVLDLGCGPGLYCTRLHQRGLDVTGVDFSHNSIEYARQYARDNGLAIEYVCQNYLTVEYEEEFDAAFIICLDFGVLSDENRDEFLARVHRALKPGGAFVFDVATPNRRAPADGEESWAIRPSGF